MRFPIPARRRKHPHPETVPRKGTVQLVDLDRVAKTDQVLVDPRVVSRFFQHAALHPRNEVGGLLLGHLIGRYLVVEDIVMATNIGTAVNIEFTPQDFDNAQKAAKEGQCVLGWAHSHPTYGAFLSATDMRFQTQGQGLFRDYVALVLDPFHERGVDYAFFRVQDDQSVQVPHHYLGEFHATRTPSPDP